MYISNLFKNIFLKFEVDMANSFGNMSVIDLLRYKYLSE